MSQIFSLALDGLGSVSIASELEKRKILTPAVYKYQHGDRRFARYSSIQNGDYYSWRSATISQILINRVYSQSKNGKAELKTLYVPLQ